MKLIGCNPVPVVCLSEAARQTGIHRQQLQRMLKSGRLADFDFGHDESGRQLIEVDGLLNAVRSRVRRRIDSRAWDKVAEPATPQWTARHQLMVATVQQRIEALVAASHVPQSDALQALINDVAAELGSFYAALLDL